MKSKVAILTDTNSSIAIKEAEELGIYMILMPVLIDGKEYLEEKDISKEFFFEKLKSGAEVTTSQPSPGIILEMYDKILQEYDELVYIPMSSGLSGTCQTAKMLAQDYEGRVHVVDNGRITITMMQAVFDALAMAGEGKSGAEIKEYLEEDALNAPIYLVVDDLNYLKKGGRVTAATAAIATVLNIKPVLHVNGGKIDTFAKVRGSKQAVKTMFKAIEAEKSHRFAGKKYRINAAYAGDDSIGEAWKKELMVQYPDVDIKVYSLPMSISTHVGPGTIGVTIYSYYEN